MKMEEALSEQLFQGLDKYCVHAPLWTLVLFIIEHQWRKNLNLMSVLWPGPVGLQFLEEEKKKAV